MFLLNLCIYFTFLFHVSNLETAQFSDFVDCISHLDRWPVNVEFACLNWLAAFNGPNGAHNTFEKDDLQRKNGTRAFWLY